MPLFAATDTRIMPPLTSVNLGKVPVLSMVIGSVVAEPGWSDLTTNVDVDGLAVTVKLDRV